MHACVLETNAENAQSHLQLPACNVCMRQSWRAEHACGIIGGSDTNTEGAAGRARTGVEQRTHRVGLASTCVRQAQAAVRSRSQAALSAWSTLASSPTK
jgi:hypothetical protein